MKALNAVFHGPVSRYFQVYHFLNKNSNHKKPQAELKKIISGNSTTLDLIDLKTHTRYLNCSAYDSHINFFWKSLQEMTSENQLRFLKFCTSCSRPPITGFDGLVPNFTVELIQVTNDGERLPTAQTCFNLLRLPMYSSYQVMKEKLEYAINSGAGFELT